MTGAGESIGDAARPPVHDAVEELFFELLDDDSDPTAAPPGAADAVLAYLRARHVEGVVPAAAWERTAELPGVLARVLAAAGPDATRALIALALVADPRQARPLAEVLIGAVPPADLARALLDALAGGDAHVRRPIGELVYRTFDAAGDDYHPGDELRARLTAALS